MNTLNLALGAGGYVVIGMFGPNRPEKCSGFQTLRLAGDELFKLLPEGFEKLSTSTDVHITPWGSSPEFSYLLARRR